MATSTITQAKEGGRNLPGGILIAAAVAVWLASFYFAGIIVGFGLCDAEDGLPERGSPQDSWCYGGPGEPILFGLPLLALAAAIFFIVRWMKHWSQLGMAAIAVVAIPVIQVLALLIFSAPSDNVAP